MFGILRPCGPVSRQVGRWKRILKNFLKALTYKTGKQLVLKSPPHTGRVKVLKDMFPEAKFIHIIRDPYVVFSSTTNMWKAMYKSHGLQRPTYEGLEEQVFQNYLRLHARLEEAKAILEPRQYFSLKYEDLIRDPEGQMRAVYEHFQMSGFDEYLPRLRRLPRRAARHETNRYQLDERQRGGDQPPLGQNHCTIWVCPTRWSRYSRWVTSGTRYRPYQGCDGFHRTSVVDRPGVRPRFHWSLSLLSSDSLAAHARTGPMLFVHAGAAAVIFTGGTLVDWLVFAAMIPFRGFFITVAFHRYFSHRSFKTSRVTQFVMAFFGAGNIQNGALWWAAHHRQHHLHSDEAADPHSPVQRGFWWAHMGWLFSTLDEPEWDKVRDLTRYPELVWLDASGCCPAS